MAAQPLGFVQHTLENIVSNPIRATLTVGTCIIVLLQVVHVLMEFWPTFEYLLFLVPFVPPFFISRTAMRINQRTAEHDFIKDAVPYIFVSYPDKPTVEALLNAKPDMISNSASQHFNRPLDELLKMPALPAPFFEHPNERKSLIQAFINDYEAHNGYGVIPGFEVTLKPHGQERAHSYLVNGVLKEQKGRLKWQATLMRRNGKDVNPHSPIHASSQVLDSI